MSDERRIEYIAVSELMTRLHPANPKQHDIGQLIESFKVHGYVASGVIDDRTGLFLAGHGRVQALNMMRKQGMDAPDGIHNGDGDWLVPVQVGYSSKNDMQAKAYIIADNRLTTLGGWNEVALAELLQELENSDEVDIAASGYDADDLDNLLRDLGMQEEPTPDPGAQVDRAAELNKKWQVKRGDVWSIGAHRIMCGDSTSAEDVALLMGGVKADMVFTDPPYNGSLGRDGFVNDHALRKWVNKNKENIESLYDFDPSIILGICKGITIEASSWFFFCNKNLVPNYINYALNNNKLFDILLWHKPDFIPMANNHYYPDTEYLIKVKSKGAVFNAGLDKEVASYGTYWVVKVKKGDDREAAHPTIKPAEIIKNQLLICSLSDQIIFDPFLGSGTTIVAAHQTGRVGYGMEISPEYVSVCLERLAGMGLTPERSK